METFVRTWTSPGDRKGVCALRLTFGIILFVLAGALAVCSEIARKNDRAVRRAAATLLLCTIPPVAGNAVITLSSQRVVSTLGCYTYHVGMDLLIAALLHFTFFYCRLRRPRNEVRRAAYVLLLGKKRGKGCMAGYAVTANLASFVIGVLLAGVVPFVF